MCCRGGAALEGSVAEFGHACGQFDAGEGAAIQEGVSGKLGDVAAELDLAEEGRGVEELLAQCAGHGGSDVGGLQVGATSESVMVD